jgi:hypothetical protein
MTDTKYNGWTNYATWRVNLEVFDGMDWVDVFGNPDPDLTDPYECSRTVLSLALKDYAEEVVLSGSSGLVNDYAQAFLSDVNWYEIADHMVRDYIAENEAA